MKYLILPITGMAIATLGLFEVFGPSTTFSNVLNGATLGIGMTTVAFFLMNIRSFKP